MTSSETQEGQHGRDLRLNQLPKCLYQRFSDVYALVLVNEGSGQTESALP